MSSSDWETQFVNNPDWHTTNIHQDNASAEEMLRKVLAAESWIQNNCEPDSAFRFGSRFYFKNKDDLFQFTLIWA